MCLPSFSEVRGVLISLYLLSTCLLHTCVLPFHRNRDPFDGEAIYNLSSKRPRSHGTISIDKTGGHTSLWPSCEEEFDQEERSKTVLLLKSLL